MMRRRPAAGILLLFFSILLAGCSVLAADRAWRTSPEEATPTPIPTSVVPTNPTYTVQSGEVVKQLQFTGRVSPAAEEALFFRTSGRVRDIKAERGQTVKRGDVLADLEIDPLERDLAAARLQQDRAQLRLDAAGRDVNTQLQRARLNLEIAQLNLQAVRAQDPAPRKAAAEADLERSKLALDQAQAAYNGIAWRNDKGASPEAAALQQATIAYNQAKANYDLAIQAIDDHGYQVGILERQVRLAQLDVDALQPGGDPLLKNDLDAAVLAVKKLEASVADAQLVAPFDGKVMSLSIEEGRAVNAYDPAIVLANTGKLEIRADVLQTDVAKLETGMPASLALASRPGEVMAGKIGRLPYSSAASSGDGQAAQDNDKSTHVTLDDPGQAAQLAQGDLVNVTVILESKKDVLWLPPQAIRTYEGRKFVVVQDGERQRRADVRLGIESPDRVEIAEGLTAGQIVAGQ